LTERPIDALAVSLLDGASCIETIPDTEVAPSRVHGRALFARRARFPDEVLGTLDGQVVDVGLYPAVMALEWNALSPERLLVRAIRTSYGFMNHSGRPNVSIDDDGVTMRACLPIAPGEELTLDYFAQPVPPEYLASAEVAAFRT
jgi:hypothetical protein